MRDEHIISLIESAPLASLSENDLTAIRAHTDQCSGCLRAFQAAQVSALLLQERAAETFEPSPFFHTRVLATLRERQAANGSWANSWALGRLWQTAGALASSMVATVAALAVLTFVIPGSQVASGQQLSSLANNYSAEEVILDQNPQPDEQLSDGQLLTTIYSGEEEAR
jgi:biotin carboxyl carrier protein